MNLDNVIVISCTTCSKLKGAGIGPNRFVCALSPNSGSALKLCEHYVVSKKAYAGKLKRLLANL